MRSEALSISPYIETPKIRSCPIQAGSWRLMGRLKAHGIIIGELAHYVLDKCSSEML